MSSLELLKEYETQIQQMVIINKELIQELNEERHKNKKLTIRKEKTGFCVKINEPSQPICVYQSSDSNYLSSNSENSW